VEAGRSAGAVQINGERPALEVKRRQRVPADALDAFIRSRINGTEDCDS
jgi:hypothetical protein